MTIIRIPTFACLLLALLVAAPAAGYEKQKPAAKPPIEGLKTSFLRHPKELGRITFAVAGDVIPHKPVKEAAAANNRLAPEGGGPLHKASLNHDGWDALFEPVADVFRGVDYGFVNLETPVAPKSSRGSKPFQFDAPPALLDALQTSGVKFVSFANNHVFDQHFSGFAETIANLRARGILFTGAGDDAGAAWQPLLLEKYGVRVGILGMTRWLNGYRNPRGAAEPHVAFVPYTDDPTGAPGVSEEFVLEKIRAAKTQCDLLLISIHWGLEYAAVPRVEDVGFAHAMLENGASLVIGHHPHVLQPVETYVTSDERTGFILYSLGNFLSNQARNYTHGLTPEKTGEMRDSLIVTFSAVKKDYGPGGIQYELADLGLLPVWTENNLPYVKGGPAQKPIIRPVFIDREFPIAQAAADALLAKTEPLLPEEKTALRRALKRVELLRRRREILLGRTGDEYLIAPPPVPVVTQ